MPTAAKATAASFEGNGAADTAFSLLCELQGAHHALLACMTVMEQLTRAAEPDSTQLLKARHKISHASLKRRQTCQRAHNYLRPKATSQDREILRQLAALDADYFRRSSEHLSQWPGAAALADWKGFRAASANIRRHMESAIRNEQSLLYPLLNRYR